MESYHGRDRTLEAKRFRPVELLISGIAVGMLSTDSGVFVLGLAQEMMVGLRERSPSQ